LSKHKEDLDCLNELGKILKNKKLISKLSDVLFYAVYDTSDNECRYFSVLDRLATSVSKYSAKAALFDLKRGSLTGSTTPIQLDEDARRAFDVIELCLDIEELHALEVLKTIALSALTKCFLRGKSVESK